MSKMLGYRVDDELKKEYDELIERKYENKHSNCGKTIGSLMKLYLTINGGSDYGDDPGVQAMLKSIRRGSPCTHTQQSHEPKDDSNDLVEQIKEMRKELKEVKEQLAEQKSTQNQRKIGKEQKRYRDHSIDGLVSSFYDEYGDDQQVSYTDISKLVMKTHGVLDKRSIHNRVQYLLAEGCIEPFAPNVYNIMR